MGTWRVALLLLASCSGSDKGGLDAPPRDDAGTTFPASSCADGQLAVDVANGQLTCTAPGGLAREAIGEYCSAYLGWRDDCDDCATPPEKWGRTGTASCLPGRGDGNTCTTPALGAAKPRLLGLALDGDMDGNDKLYAGLHCAADRSLGDGVAPCPPGQLVDGFNGTAWTCTSFAKAAIAYVGASCSIFLGWQDECNGCTTPPAKWGSTSAQACSNGAGDDNTCIAPTPLGSEAVRLFGLNPDGDVDGNDKLHIGLHCEPPPSEGSMQTTSCPAGQYVAEVLPSGGFRCASAAPAIATYFAEHCTLYFGWQDDCEGCQTPPSKWGKVRVGACENGVGADNTCSKLALGPTVDMFGLSPDGDVDGNDVLYVGFHCD